MSTIRVITANLLNGRATPSALKRLLRAERPHVFAAQELAPNAARVVADEMHHGVLNPRIDYHGNGLALRREGVVERFDLDHRQALRALLVPELWPELTLPLEVITVHIASPVVRPFGKSREMRRRQIEQLMEHVRAEPRVRIVLGDFNATPLWPAYRKVAAVMTDAPRAVGSHARTWAPTWWMPRLLRIDHVFSQGLIPIKSRTRRVLRSDHSALVVDFELG